MARLDSPSWRPVVEAAPIQFTEWVPWCGGRGRLKRPEPSIGVYLWAHFAVPPAAAARPYPDLPKELIYVGETRNLNRRPLSGGHHRLDHYRDKFPDDWDLKSLYVSVFHIESVGRGRSHLLRAFTRYVEDMIYWQYVQRFGERAALDYKRGKGGP